MNILDWHIARGGGIVAGPQGLGVLVGREPKLTPAGWLFVDIDNPPPDTQAVLAALTAARKQFPDIPSVAVKIVPVWTVTKGHLDSLKNS